MSQGSLQWKIVIRHPPATWKSGPSLGEIVQTREAAWPGSTLPLSSAPGNQCYTGIYYVLNHKDLPAGSSPLQGFFTCPQRWGEFAPLHQLWTFSSSELLASKSGKACVMVPGVHLADRAIGTGPLSPAGESAGGNGLSVSSFVNKTISSARRKGNGLPPPFQAFHNATDCVSLA